MPAIIFNVASLSSLTGTITHIQSKSVPLPLSQDAPTPISVLQSVIHTPASSTGSCGGTGSEISGPRLSSPWRAVEDWQLNKEEKAS